MLKIRLAIYTWTPLGQCLLCYIDVLFPTSIEARQGRKLCGRLYLLSDGRGGFLGLGP